MLPGRIVNLVGIDMCSKDSKYLACDATVYNAQTPCGMPPHVLRLKRVRAIVTQLSSTSFNTGSHRHAAA